MADLPEHCGLYGSVFLVGCKGFKGPAQFAGPRAFVDSSCFVKVDEHVASMYTIDYVMCGIFLFGFSL